jgi:hypothetical protein
VGSSQVGMSKVWLKFYYPLDDWRCLMTSRRKYQNFKIQRGLPTDLRILLDKFQWKRVYIRDDLEMDPEVFRAFLLKLSPTLEEVELWDIAVKGDIDIARIDFPLLKSIEYNLTTPNTFAVFLGNNPHLERVNLSTGGINSHNALQVFLDHSCMLPTFFKKNSNIKTLIKDFNFNPT